MTRQFLLAGAVALALAACNNSASNRTEGSATPAEKAATPDANPAATIPTPANETSVPGFVNAAGGSDMFEVQAGRLARERSRNPQVRAFAEMMITAHTATTRELTAALRQANSSITPPAQLPESLTNDLASLRNASPADFDLAYMNGQVDGHQNTLNVMQRYAQDGDPGPLRDFAAATAPHVQEHLTRAREIRDVLNQRNDGAGGNSAGAAGNSAQ
jgi:putative membrane protein